MGQHRGGWRDVGTWRGARRRMVRGQDLHQVHLADAAMPAGAQVDGGDAPAECSHGLWRLWRFA
jgi:hypothetical protein